MRIGSTLAGAAAIVSGASGVAIFALVQVRMESATLAVASAVAGAATAAVVTLAMAPFAFRIDRDARRLRAYLRQLGRSSGRSDVPSGGGPIGSLIEDVTNAFERMQDSVDTAAGAAREEQIRRRIAEAERDHAEAVVQSLQDAVIVTDVYSDIKIANNRAAELFHFDQDAMANHPIDEVVADERLRRIIHESLAVATPNHRRRVDHTMSVDGAPDHGERCYDVSLISLPGADNDVSGVVTILRDVTLEREISQMKSDFVSKASHELRTPLSSINAYLEMLLDGEAADDESRFESYQIMKNEADRLGRMIDNMLNISRIESGVIRAKFEDLDFVKASNRAVEVIQPQAQAKNITVKVISGPLVYSAVADQDMVHQVFLNLLSNAIKYTPEGGRVTVTIENDDATGCVMTSIADTGLGIPPDLIDKVFDKFYRIENYKRVASGTGLGLSLVKQIVETVHRGQVSVESKLGLGSRFTFSIPYEQPGV